MTKKKTVSKAKKNTMKTKTKNVSEYEIKDIDAMIEDMKNLALEKPEEKEEPKSKVVAHEEVKDEEKDNVVNSTEETNKEEEDSFTGPLVKCEFDEEGKLINKDEGCLVLGVNLFDTEEESTKEENENEVIEEKKIEDMQNEETVVTKIVEEMEEEEPKVETPAPKKSKRKTYQEMFGGTWMGYGYDHF